MGGPYPDRHYRQLVNKAPRGAHILTLLDMRTFLLCLDMRRKFFEAETGDPPFREWMLKQFGRLFDLEEKGWQQSGEERLLIRQRQEAPIIDEMIDKVKARLVKGKILPKSKFKEALGYFASLTPYLKNYTLHANARLDNNVAERALRPLGHWSQKLALFRQC